MNYLISLLSIIANIILIIIILNREQCKVCKSCEVCKQCNYSNTSPFFKGVILGTKDNKRSVLGVRNNVLSANFDSVNMNPVTGESLNKIFSFTYSPLDQQLRADGKCIEQDGDTVVLADCNDSRQQRWKLTEDEIRSISNNKCISGNDNIMGDCSTFHEKTFQRHDGDSNGRKWREGDLRYLP